MSPKTNGTLTSTSRRSTVSTPSPAPSGRKKGNNGQCTHLTMTRLYTKDFRCAACMRTGAFGWIYRCTQDRELLLENDLDNGDEETFDTLPDIFERSTIPNKRSPAARISKFSFLQEISDAELRTYTTDQLRLILAQRAQVLDLATAPELDLTTNSPVATSASKPWLPLRGGECQFKCCHTCRPTLNERSHLRLNAIASSEVPATALLGFGFHLQKRRPVMDARLVRNLGLRPNPPPHLPQTPTTPMTPNPSYASLPASPTPSSRRNTTLGLHPILNSGLGLGIINTEAQHPNASPNLTEQTLSIPAKPSLIPLPTQHVAAQLVPRPLPALPRQRTIWNFREMSTLPVQARRGVDIPALNLPARWGSNIHIATQVKDVVDAGKEAGGKEGTESFPSLIPEQVVKTGALTPMEEKEQAEGFSFGKEPLQVEDGVAVLEESVGLHVPDVVTQF